MTTCHYLVQFYPTISFALKKLWRTYRAMILRKTIAFVNYVFGRQ